MTIGLLDDQLEVLQDQLDDLAKLEPRPELVQLDIVDGQFADNLTIEAATISQLDTHNFPLEVHLMVVEPIYTLEELVDISTVKSVVGQVERMSSQSDFLDALAENNWQAGLSLDIYTPVEAIEVDWSRLATVQIMGGLAGSQGQEFNRIALDKIKLAREKIDQQKLNCRIVVDIGMNPDTIVQAKQAGAHDFVVGSYLLSSPNMADSWKKLRQAEGGSK